MAVFVVAEGALSVTVVGDDVLMLTGTWLRVVALDATVIGWTLAGIAHPINSGPVELDLLAPGIPIPSSARNCHTRI